MSQAVASLPAEAQPGPKDGVTAARDEARQLAEQGITDIDQGKAAEGVPLLEQAEAKFHAPTHLLYLGRGYDKLGKLGLAAECYERLVSESLPNYAPDAFRNAQRLGREELASLEPRLASIVVALRGAKADAATVAIDGRAARPLLDRLAVEGGHHVVLVTVGAETRTAEVTLADREEKHIELVFAEAKSAVGAPRVPQADTAPEITHPFVVPSIVAFTVGGGALIAGTATGVLSLQKVSTLSSRCPTKMGCNPADQSLANDARTLGNVSTATFVVGGVGVVAGIVLAAIPVTRPRTRSARSPSVDVEPFLAVGGAGIRGDF